MAGRFVDEQHVWVSGLVAGALQRGFQGDEIIKIVGVEQDADGNYTGRVLLEHLGGSRYWVSIEPFIPTADALLALRDRVVAHDAGS